ncbi:MAG TPA: ABC transporter permease [Spirochaetota bacterium]|nr:ABC transporter permease [Spirochaetota bacterium]OPZ37059.1 MAG: putative phospholipid ABC transporter permease protein MlaE [Spirochaetes bacterium ADurb.BinA120]HNU90954.1 ABC transporter permease [Spirochaetota bacterium]HPI13304.1 ABC transporter permease [Spirochaetota bacterium]HPO44563.1 ABC transporter permease [Spirochaetota bacterium]
MTSSGAGKLAVSLLEGVGRYAVFFADTVRWTFRPPFDRRNLTAQMLEIGYRSLPVTAVTLFFTGMVMALQIGNAMDKIMTGSSIFIGSAVAISMFRELCPVLTALLLAGRVGSAIAAEIGTMKVTEQIDALVTLSANPIQYLSVPRFLACLVMTPALTVITDVVGVLGGAFVAYFSLNITIDKYIENILQNLRLVDFMTGILKSVFFGIQIAIVSCYQGFNTSGGAEGVGKATIQAVVKSSMAILISDYFLTYLFQFFE